MAPGTELPNHVGCVPQPPPCSFYPSENLQSAGNEVLPLSLCVIEIFIWLFE